MRAFDSSTHLPSAPYRPARFFIYFRDPERRILGGHGFLTKGAARGMIEMVLDQLPEHRLKWRSPESLDTQCGILIEGHSLEDIMESSSIELPHPYDSFAAGIAGREPPLFMSTGEPEERKPRRPREKPPGEPRRKAPTDGGVTAADLAEELRLSPSALRKLIRKHSIPKPYLWTPGPELDKLKALLSGST